MKLRAKLSLLLGVLFIASGAILLTITYLLVRHAPRTYLVRNLRDGPTIETTSGPMPIPQSLDAAGRRLAEQAMQQHADELHALLTRSIIALAIMAVVAMVAGWLLAGRLLRPLRTMITSIRQISGRNVHDRLAAAGPQDELKDLSDTVDGLLQRLETALAAHKRFVANAAHELRTPLTVEHALIEEMLTDRTAKLPQYRSLFERLLELRKQQAAMLESLLTLAGSERGLERRDHVDLSAIAERTVAAYQPAARLADVRVDTRIDSAWTTGDPALIERLVVNLLDNAIAYNVPGGWVEITTRVRDGRAVLRVANTGTEIPAERVEALFEPFQRLDRTAGRAGHHGLGLSIVRAIATAHDATVTASPRPGGGLRIEATFGARRELVAAGGVAGPGGADQLGCLVLYRSARGIRQGFPLRSAGGSAESGASWKVTGRTNRCSAAAPTEVCAGAVVAGHGPPCCWAQVTATPVGQPFTTTRPQRRDSRSTSGPRSGSAPLSPCTPAARLPGSTSSTAARSAGPAYSATRATGPKTSSSRAGAARRAPGATASTAGCAAHPSVAGEVRASTVAPARSSSRTPSSNAAAICSVSSQPCGAAAVSAAATRSARPDPAGTSSSPGLVQNCPIPRVNDPTNPVAIASARAAAAAGVTTTVLTVPISA